MLSKEELNKYAPWLISVAKTGSSVLPWIECPHDTDYVFYLTDNHLGEKIVELTKKRPQGECWLLDDPNSQFMRIYAYQYHYLQPIYGKVFPKYDVLEHIPEYKKMLVELGLSQEPDVKTKQWYHILTGIYLIQNGKYELTDDQIKNIRICYNKEMTLDIYNYIREQLLQYKIELEADNVY